MIRNAYSFGSAMLALVAWPTTGLAEIKAVPSLTVSGSAGYSSNPFLEPATGGDSLFTQFDIVPQLDLTDEVSQGVISARYSRIDYIDGFGSSDGYGLTASGSRALSQRLTLGLSLSYDSQILGAGNNFRLSPIVAPVQAIPAAPGQPGQPVSPIISLPATPIVIDPIGADVGFIGQRQRRNLLATAGTLTFQPSGRETWVFGLNASRVSYPNDREVFFGYRSFGGNLVYRRALTERSSIGANLTAQVVDYQEGETTRTYIPQLTFETALSPLWTLSAAIGAGIVDRPGGTSVGVSGSGSLCRRQERSSLCLALSRGPAPTGLGTVRSQTNASVSYSQQVSERTSLSANASYSRLPLEEIRTPNGLRVSGMQSFLSAEARVDRRFGEIVQAFAVAGYRDVSGLGANVDADLTARAGLSVRFGGRR